MPTIPTSIHTHIFLGLLCDREGKGWASSAELASAMDELMNDTSIPCHRFVGTQSYRPRIKLLSLRGLNLNHKWADLIYEGQKRIELRTYPIGNYVEEPLWIISTPGEDKSWGKAKITGMILFKGCIKYKSLKHVHEDVARHCVEESSRFFMPKRKADSEDTTYYGWKIARVLKFAEPREGPDTKGMIGCQSLRLAVDLGPLPGSSSEGAMATDSTEDGTFNGSSLASPRSPCSRSCGVGRVFKPRKPSLSPTDSTWVRKASRLFGDLPALPLVSSSSSTAAPSSASSAALADDGENGTEDCVQQHNSASGLYAI